MALYDADADLGDDTAPVPPSGAHLGPVGEMTLHRPVFRRATPGRLL